MTRLETLSVGNTLLNPFICDESSIGRDAINTYPKTTPYPNHDPRGAPISVPGIPEQGFGESSEGPSESSSDNPTKYPYPVPIIKTASGPSDTPTKYTLHVPKKLSSANPSNMLIECPSGYSTGDTSTMTTENPSSKPRA